MNLVLNICLFSQLGKWLDTTRIPKTFEDLSSMLLRDQFRSSCDASVAAFLCEKSVCNNSDMANLAERYMDAHSLTFIGLKKSIMKEKGISSQPRYMSMAVAITSNQNNDPPRLNSKSK